MFSRVFDVIIILFWISVVIVYPMLISIYVTLPLFVGFAGLILAIGIYEERYWFVTFSLVYMLNLELNLSLPLLLLPISVVIFFLFVKLKLSFIKSCKKCVYIITVLSINGIYFALLAGYDFINSQNSVNYDSIIGYSILYDIIAAVFI